MADTVPVLGQGFDSVALVPREPCQVPGTRILSAEGGGSSRSGLSAAEAIGYLGLGEPVPSLALLGGTPLASARRHLVDDGYAIDRWRLAEIVGLTESFAGAGQWLVDPAAAEFTARCGDQVVAKLVPGGQALTGWRIEVGTHQGRFDLEREVGHASAWVESSLAAEELRRKLASWKGRAVLRVVALQRGGDPALLSAAVGDGTASPAWTLDCAVDDLGSCGAFLDRALGVLSQQAVWSSIMAAPAVLRSVQDGWWTASGPSLNWSTPTEVAAARRQLAVELGLQAAVQSRLSVLETGLLDLAPSVAAKLPAWRATADANLALVADALRDCGERLTDWTDAAQVARCAAGGTHAALVARGLDEALTAAAMEAVPAAP